MTQWLRCAVLFLQLSHHPLWWWVSCRYDDRWGGGKGRGRGPIGHPVKPERPSGQVEVWGGAASVRRVSGGWNPCLPHRDIHIWWDTNIINCKSQTLVGFYNTCWYEVLDLDIYLTWFFHTHSSPSRSWILCMCTNTLFMKKKYTCEDWGVPAQFWQSDHDSPFLSFSNCSPEDYHLGCDCARD